MTKSSSPQSAKVGRNAVTGNAATGRYATVGRTSDGVTVLQPSTPPTHFTTSQARTAISKLGLRKK